MESVDWQQLSEQMGAAYRAGGLLAALGTFIYLAVQVYRDPAVQAFIGARWPQARWDALPYLTRMAIVVGAGILNSVLLALATGTPWAMAIVPGAVAGFLAMGQRAAMKHVGIAVDQAALKRDPDYTPGPARRAASIIVPIDEGLARRANGWPSP